MSEEEFDEEEKVEEPEAEFIRERRPDSTRRTPTTDFDDMFNTWRDNKVSPSRKRLTGFQIINQAKAVLEKEYDELGLPPFKLPQKLGVLFEDIENEFSGRDERSKEGKKSLDEELCVKMSFIIDNFLYGQLLKYKYISRVYAEELIDVTGKSGASTGFRAIPSSGEAEEVRKLKKQEQERKIKEEGEE